MHDNNEGHSFAGVESDASKTKQFFQVFSNIILVLSVGSARPCGHVMWSFVCKYVQIEIHLVWKGSIEEARRFLCGLEH